MNRSISALRMALVVAALVFADFAAANNMRVVKVRLTADAGGHTFVAFNINWENSWRLALAGDGQGVPYNYDAAWIFVKYSTDGGTTWRHATLANNAMAHTVLQDNGVPAAFETTADGKGVFAFRANNGGGDIAWQDVKVRWNYSSDGVSSLTPQTIVQVFALEMVYVPAGAFVAGDGSSHAALRRGAGDHSPWPIASEDAIHVTGASAGGFYYVSGGNSDENATGASFTIPAAFPKGYQAFYVMKYEISQGQYADFLNTLTPAQAANRDITSASGYSSFRGTISGSHPIFEAAVPDRACNFLSFMDGAAFADWAGLRPMTELEMEKAGRGTAAAVAGEFAWGNTDAVAATTLSGDEDGTETVTTTGANSHFGNKTLSGGNGGNGPVRPGIFAATVNPADAAEVQRRNAGASFYGLMELSGNLWERAVTIGNAKGRGFLGSHGDGHLNDHPSFAGNATNADWPGFSGAPGEGVGSALGAGYRGGSWQQDAASMRVSQRANAATYQRDRLKDFGFRAARTANPMTGGD